jgi:PhnB protein
MMKLIAYLAFNGECEAAFKVYEQILGGTIVAMIPHEGTPAEGHVPPEWKSKIMHARLKIGDAELMGGDAPPGMYEKPRGFSVSIHEEDVEKGRRIFDALGQGGTVVMPFEPTFWSPGFGMVIDRFGAPWMVNCGPSD